MRRVVLYEFGSFDNLVVEDGPDPRPGNDEVVVAVEAAGVGFVDSLCVRGVYQALPSLPWVPGCELAGSVVAVGDDVTGTRVGDRVMATSFVGGFRSHLALAATDVAPIPGGLSAGQAAGLVARYGTMLYALQVRTTIAPGEWVVVLGAGGAIGLAAIDLAVAQGARVVACASTQEKLAHARRAGAEAFIAYEDADVDLKRAIREATGGGADVVVDPVGGAKSEPALRALRFEGRYLVIGFASGDIPTIALNQALLNNRTIIGIDWGDWALHHPGENAELLSRLFRMVDEGALQPGEPVTYPLEEAATALDDVAHRRVAGKVVLVP
jgi:NADPH2:quinone reductase